MKLFDKETFEEIIWNLIEDSMELSEETKNHIAQGEKDIREDHVYTHEQVKKILGV